MPLVCSIDPLARLCAAATGILRCPLNHIGRYVLPIFIAEDAAANLPTNNF